MPPDGVVTTIRIKTKSGGDRARDAWYQEKLPVLAKV